MGVGALFENDRFFAMSTCTAVVHSFQNPICTAAFFHCHELFHFFVHIMCDIVNSHLLQIFRVVLSYGKI